MKQYDVLKPDCYRRFSCKGGSCRYSCCSEWRITMSKEEYRRVKKKGLTLDGLVRLSDEGRRTELNYYEVVLDENGSCPFLTEDKLCNLQCQFGPDILSGTCRNYPRIYHRYMDKLEGGLSLGCERVLELLSEEKKLVFLNSVESLPDDYKFNTSIDFKQRRKLPETIYYYDIQSLCLGILQAEDAAMEDKLILLGMAVRHIGELAKKGREKEIPGYITHFLNSVDGVDAASQLQQMDGEHIGVLFHNLLMAKTYMSGGANHYEKLIEKIGKKLKTDIFLRAESLELTEAVPTINCSVEAYRAGQENYRRFMEGKEHFLENVMVGFMFQCNLPFLNPENGIWKNYTYMVWTYSMLKFILTMALDEDSTEEDMIDVSAVLFRKLGHNRNLYDRITADFEKNNCSTLAHMAVLLKS